MIFSKKQIDDLLSIIKLDNNIFIATNVGIDFFSALDRELLFSNGLNLIDFEKSTLEEQFRFGILSIILGDEHFKSMTFDQIKGLIWSKQYLPLTSLEKEVLSNVLNFSYSQLKGLQNRIVQDYETFFIEQDDNLRILYENNISTEAEISIKKRESVKQLASRIGHKTKDWSRDLGRISDYIIQHSFDKARITKIVEKFGSDAQIYKNVYAGACKHCIGAYLTGGIGSEPKVFKAIDLINNGSNIGKKVSDWLPVIGPLHPFCRCTSHYLQNGQKWNSSSNSFEIIKPVNNRKRTAKVTINK